MSWFHRNRVRVLVAGLLAFSFLLLVANLKSPRNQNWLDRILVRVTAPLEDGIVRVIDGTVHLWKNYIFLVGVREDNQKLKAKLESLQRELPKMQELQAENLRLRELAGMKQQLLEQRVVAARVVGVGTSPVARTIRIDAGSGDGLKVGDAVIGSAGLVGRVSGVVGGYAEVTLLVDGRSAVDVVIEGSRDRAIVRGQGEDQSCSVNYLRRTAQVEVGNQVVTSGIGGSYPAGLVVGKITRVTSPKVGVFREAELKPAVSFQRLEEVLVVQSTHPEAKKGSP